MARRRRSALLPRGDWDGRFMATMCLSEPQAASGLAEITTRAVPDGAEHTSDPLGPRYRLHGNKMWISGENSGSLDSLNVSSRCGCRPKARQMRETAVWKMSISRAMVRVLQ